MKRPPCETSPHHTAPDHQTNSRPPVAEERHCQRFRKGEDKERKSRSEAQADLSALNEYLGRDEEQSGLLDRVQRAKSDIEEGIKQAKAYEHGVHLILADARTKATLTDLLPLLESAK